MGHEPALSPAAWADATAPMPAGPLLRLSRGAVQVDVAPEAGGRIAQIRFDGDPQLVGADDGWPATIAWGCYPMVPWAGRIRRGAFAFEGRAYRLPCNYEAHAIHGVGFSRSWTVDDLTADACALSLRLPSDGYWPFGGVARQRIALADDGVIMRLSVEAGERAMPATIGWHPWFRKPDRIEVSPRHVYPRDAEGIATLPLALPGDGPRDDCFLHDGPVLLHRNGQRIRLQSDCRHWVIFDGVGHAACIEPQTGPPDAFNLLPEVLAPGERLQMALSLTWLRGDGGER